MYHRGVDHFTTSIPAVAVVSEGGFSTLCSIFNNQACILDTVFINSTSGCSYIKLKVFQDHKCFVQLKAGRIQPLQPQAKLSMIEFICFVVVFVDVASFLCAINPVLSDLDFMLSSQPQIQQCCADITRDILYHSWSYD